MLKKIMVPLDGSRFASRALKYGEEIASKFEGELLLFQVVKPAIPITTSGGDPMMQSPAGIGMAIKMAMEEDKRRVSKAKRYLSKKARELKDKNINSTYKVMIGDPAESIMIQSKKNKVDIIIMTTHGKTGIIRAVMGSVADEVVRKSGKPVLVIRPKRSK